MNSDKRLHIISFDNPWPPDYGGAIDVFHRIRILSENGVRIVLHAFVYGRRPAEELNSYCEKIYWYKRKRWVNPFSVTPYIVITRQHPELLKNLMEDSAPVLFEGLHTCSLLGHKLLQDRVRIVRMHNIEHRYYHYLACNDPNLIRKAWFEAESVRLKRFEKILSNASAIIAISENDRRELAERFPRTVMIGPFHGNESVSAVTGKGSYALYHGKLSVAENYRAAAYLAGRVFSHTDYPLVIAGSQPPGRLKRLVRKSKNIELLQNPTPKELDNLIREAHINILPAFQPTGAKLKLINALFRGRYIIVNRWMVTGSGYEGLCSIADSDSEMINLINSLRSLPFGIEQMNERKKGLTQPSSSMKDINKLLDLIT